MDHKFPEKFKKKGFHTTLSQFIQENSSSIAVAIDGFLASHIHPLLLLPSPPSLKNNQQHAKKSNNNNNKT